VGTSLLNLEPGPLGNPLEMVGFDFSFSLLLTWLVKSSVGYAGRPGPGASRLGSRVPTGL
jgi:hypothetical protein